MNIILLCSSVVKDEWAEKQIKQTRSIPLWATFNLSEEQFPQNTFPQTLKKKNNINKKKILKNEWKYSKW